jgi:hypothetical protein
MRPQVDAALRDKVTVNEKLGDALDKSFPSSDPVSLGHSDDVGQPKSTPKKVGKLQKGLWPETTNRKSKMSAPDGLVKIAREIAATITAKNDQLRLKRDELKTQLADVERQLESAADANSRASNFHTTTSVKGYDHCPNCWVRHLSKSPLIAVNRDDEEEKNPNEDISTCHTCHMDFATDESGEWWVR